LVDRLNQQDPNIMLERAWPRGCFILIQRGPLCGWSAELWRQEARGVRTSPNPFSKTYFLGMLAGTGFGVFLALSLAENGNLAPGITPGSTAWKVLKLVGILLAIGINIYQPFARAKKAADALNAPSDVKPPG
jgi:hypothetical protein